MRIIAIANQKGGIGKSTTTAALAEGLAEKGCRPLVVDLDPQGSVSYIMGGSAAPPTVYNVLRREVSAREAIRPTPAGFLLPGNTSLSSADIEFTSIGKEYLLKEALAPLSDAFDYVILDTPPALGILTVNAFAAADGVVVPTGADILSIQGITQLNQTINLVKTYCNPRVNMKGILLTRHNSRTVLGRDFRDTIADIAESLHTFVYATAIRDSVAVKEAQAQRVGLFQYAPASTTTADYRAFIDEFLRSEADTKKE